MSDIIESVVVLTWVNMRATPGYIDKPVDDVLLVLQPGLRIAIVNDPIDVDDLIWYQTTYAGAVGYVAEHDPADTQLLAFVPKLLLPVPPDTRVTQLFGEHPEFYSRIEGYPAPLKGHNGVDYGCNVGTPIVAVDNGVVMRADLDTMGFGLLVMLRHSWGETLYAHLNEIHVNVGASVITGQRLAYSGNTGTSTGPHLHFGVRLNGYDKADGWGGFVDGLLFL